jgi:hypothetical protein
VITDIEGDTSGNIWAGTRGGLTQLSSNGVLIFTYTTANSPLIDNRIESLLFDEPEGELWVGTFDGLARLQITESTQSGGSSITVYPNPLHLSSGTATQLTFSGLAQGSTVRVFSLDGHLVRQLEAFVQETAVTWDGSNDAGSGVDSGMFFFVATSREGRSTTGKFAVVREK